MDVMHNNDYSNGPDDSRRTCIQTPIVGKEYMLVSMEYVSTFTGTITLAFRYRVVLLRYDRIFGVCNIRIKELPPAGSHVRVPFLWRVGENLAVYLRELEELPAPGYLISYRGTLPKI